MFFRQLATQEATLSYLFGCGSCHVAIAVDPVLGDEQWFIDEAAKQDVKITHVIDTHVHADHYSGGRKLAELTGAAYCLHESNQGRVKFPFEALKDGQRIEVGNVHVDVLHTPGHTPDSICLLVTDKRRAEAPWFVVTGDTLFVGAAGRPDLAGKEVEMAGQLYDSIQGKLMTLPGEVEIYAGHVAGSVCGAGISGKPASTIGFERRWNPMLAMSRADFVAALTAEIPPRPAEMDRMIAANLAG
ncbi:glyoxylase-like metal-dependent hydrolase (beta-lactamase superfamily II) [Sulfuritortus calidifontis]|uniref:Glyoxylase-like metal-dependent hydrolase (Beta-lactamase superfamily II) n=1 Tax=Sulfuritortus calidifontis TaxID=1914471 RepID=A0A4R3JX55_9PROT|nr:MBL fold metallo-hydrolase [Sulfuritortus calidifontis]TCS73013.1 glyoxylase-like metal-dependent hydrolase (beta-lactamase superfamily II) [Sulfuritortus calidifontis]